MWLIAAVAVVVLAVILFILGVIGIYNTLVRYRNRYQNAFAQIAVQLKRRYDLIPNLVETAKAYIKHERETLEAVVAARNQAVGGLERVQQNLGSAESMRQLGAAEAALSGAMGRLFAVAEAYPDLKANQNMMQLTEELTSTENRVAFARQAYNDGVTEYNTYKQSFPAVLVASAFGHGQDAVLLEFEDYAAMQKAPKVSFTS